LIYEKPCFNFLIVSSLSASMGLVGSEWDIALMIEQSWMSSVMESMSNSPRRICWETSLNSKGHRTSATGPLAKGVWDAWEKCSLPFLIKASNIAWRSTIAVQGCFQYSRGCQVSKVHRSILSGIR
jgi:hypothetical protein